MTGGFAVRLDGRALRTPDNTELVVPTMGLAERVCAEWDAVDEVIDPEVMPFTRYCNAAIDRMPEKTGAVAKMLTSYAETDLLCYRATGPEALIARQIAAWDPVLRWASDAHGVRLVATNGVIPVPQPARSLDAAAAWIEGHESFGLMALHDLVSLSGSLVLAMAVSEAYLAPEAAWEISRIDERWQIEQWGEDEEAAAAAGIKRESFLRAAEFRELSRTEGDG